MKQRFFFNLVLGLMLLASVASGAVAPAATSPAAPPPPAVLTEGISFVPHRVIVKFRADVQPVLSSRGVIRTGEASLDRTLNELGVLSAKPLLPSVQQLDFEETGVWTAIQQLSANPAVEWVEPDYVAHAITEPDDPLYPQQWGLTKIEAPAAWDVVTGTQTVVIAVIDSGIDLTHPDLQANLWTNPGEIPDNSVDDDGNGYVDDIHGWNFADGSNDPSDSLGHGTQVGGVVAAATNNAAGIAGVCWECALMPVKVMADSGTANYSDIALAIRYAADKGAKVINLSLGGYAASNLLLEAIDYAVEEKDVVLVAGAGNDDTDSPFYPAAYDDVLAVAGTDEDDTKATFSNYGDWIDLAAPAVGITTTFMGGDWGAASGTSLAAPFVAGTAALVRTLHPDWSTAMVRNQLIHTTDAIEDVNPAYAGQLGSGRLNASAAMQTPHPDLSIAGTQVNGDPLGRPTPGESATLEITLRNDWWDALNVTGTLTTTDSYVTLEQSTASYGDMPSGASGTSSPAYTFTVASGAGYNHPIPFTLMVTANSGTYTTTIPFTITTRSSDEHFCGTVAENQTWTSDKTYILDCNVGIAPGYTLTIEAGTDIHFSGNYTLSVGGTLIADGTPAQPIRFMPHTEGESWGRIFFDDPGTDAQTTPEGDYLGGNLLRYVQIEGAAQGIGCNEATPYLAHVTLDGGGMDCEAGNTPLWIWDSGLHGDVQVTEGGDIGELLGTWTARSDMPTARRSLATASVGGKIYAIGGWDGNDYLNTVETYNPATDSWQAVAPMPTARSGLAAAVVDGKIYAIGGRSNSGYLNTVEEYDPATDRWRAVVSMPTVRGYLAAAVVNGKIYAIGGYTCDGGCRYLNTVEEYDPATDSWRTVAPIPTARYILAAAVVNGKVFAIGGYNDDYLNTVEAYDPATDSWQAIAPMPTARYGLAAAAVSGKLYALGGTNGNSLNTVEAYDPATNSWRAIVSMPTTRYVLAAVAVNDKIYAIGGYKSNNDLNTVEEFEPPALAYGYALLRSTVAGDLSLPTPAQVLTATIYGDATVSGHGRIQNSTIGGRVNTAAYVIIRDNTISGGLRIGSRTTVQDNILRGNISADGIATIRGNIIRNGGISVGSGATVEGNVIEDASSWGIRASGAATLFANRIVGCVDGIQAEGTVRGNLIADTRGTGLELTGSAIVEANTFIAIGGSAVKISGGTTVTLTNNNFEFNSGPYDVEDQVARDTMATVEACSNWWGTTNTTTIAQRIYDFSNDYNLGQVLYTPVLTGPVPTAPAYVRAITLTPESPVGIQTVTFDVLFSRAMDPAVEPQMTFQSTGLPRWAARSAMPTAREQLAVAAVDGKIYAIGGYAYDGSSHHMNTVEVYNPATDSWRAVAPMPTARSGLAAVAVNGKIYAIGGYGYNNGSWGEMNTMEVYNPATDSWQTVTSMPTARAGLAAVAVDGKIYAIGGNGAGILNTVEVYNPATDSWQTLAPMPTARWALAAVVVNGQIYTIGGDNFNLGCLNTVEVYDPETDTWRAVASMPTACNKGIAATVVDGKIYAIGGSGGGHTVGVYDPATDSWRTVAPMPTAREDLAAAVVDGKIYAIGGYNGSHLNTVEEMTLPTLYTDFYGGSWIAPNLYRTYYDISAQIPRGVYTLTVAQARTPMEDDGMEIAPSDDFTFTVDYAGYVSDATPPYRPSITACAGDSSDTLSATWAAFDGESEIDLYQYAIGTEPEGTQVINWTSTPLTGTTRVSMTLIAGETYYISVRARNESGLWSSANTVGVIAASNTCESVAGVYHVYLPLTLKQ